MLNQQQSSSLGFKPETDFIRIKLNEDGTWNWIISFKSLKSITFKSAADAEQDLITFLKNYEGFRNG